MYVFKNTGTMVIGVSDTLRAAEGHELVTTDPQNDTEAAVEE